jgi:hypothetical protein
VFSYHPPNTGLRAGTRWGLNGKVKLACDVLALKARLNFSRFPHTLLFLGDVGERAECRDSLLLKMRQLFLAQVFEKHVIPPLVVVSLTVERRITARRIVVKTEIGRRVKLFSGGEK